MSNGHSKQRRGGAPHARHGPQRPERAAASTASNGANGTNIVNGAGRANGRASGQGTPGASDGAKRQAKANDSRATLQPQSSTAAKPASAAPGMTSAEPSTGRASGAPLAQSAPRQSTQPAQSTRPALPVVRRRGGSVFVPPTNRAAPASPASGAPQPQAPDDHGAPSDQSQPLMRPMDEPADAFVISLAQRDLEAPIEATSVEVYSLTVERIDTLVEIDETPMEEDLANAGDAFADHTPRSPDTKGDARRPGHADHMATAQTQGADAAEADGADTTPALPALPPTPRARVGRFYAPGGPLRPDESWVERTPSANAPNAPAELDTGAAPQTPGRFGVSDATHSPASHEHYEHFDHSTRNGPRDDLGRLIDSLHNLFEQDRAVASQTGAARCGVCYLHFPLADLDYRDQEGFYVCPGCKRSLGAAHIPMVRRQQR